jgi:UPF0755 protein
MSGGKKKLIFIILGVIVLGTLSFFYFHYQIYYSKGSYLETKIFKIEKGEGNGQISSRLKNEGLISGKIYFYYYTRTHKLINKILPGEYLLSGRMTIPEIVMTITQEQNKSIKITFPEGFSLKEIAERLNENGLPGDDFLKLATRATSEILGRYDFTQPLLSGSSLEGFLFPDTYFFKKDATAESIVLKMLDNFNSKLSSNLRADIKSQNKSVYDIITMASIIEKETNNEQDRKIVSGIFWNRIKNNQALQSCATVGYVLGVDKAQYSFEDTRTASPYNTYLNSGLPKGPISNPGMASIEAAIYPQNTDYNYFLTNPKTGETLYAKTIEEHNANKAKCGL